MYFFILCCLAVFLIGGNALSVEIVGTTIRIGEILIILLGFLFILSNNTYKLSKSVKMILLWGLLSSLLILFNTLIYKFTFSQLIVAFIYLFRVVYFICIAYIIAKYLKRKNKIVHTIRFINYIYIVICFIGFFQLVFYPIAFDWYAVFERIGVYWAGDPHINRLVSTDFDPNYLSCCLLIGVSADLYLINVDKKRKWRYYVFIFIYLITIFLTQSRSGILGFALIIFVNILLSLNWNKNFILSACAILALLVVGLCFILFSQISVFVRIRGVFSDASAGARFESWAKGWDIIKKTYFIGMGYNLYAAYNYVFYGVINHTSGGLDSSLLQIVVTTGVLGLILFAIHYKILIKNNKSNIVNSLIIASLVICNFNNLLFYSLWILPFYLFTYLVTENESLRRKRQKLLLKTEN